MALVTNKPEQATRGYRLKRRAETQAETRLRIVEAAVDLHGSLGPALTSLSMIADRAGVQRRTLYAHFPDERSLLMACSGLALERDPLPDAAAWRAVRKGERLETGLTEIYAWFARNAELTACVLRDAGHHQLTREITALRFDPPIAQWRVVLGAGLSASQRALLELALSFPTWRTLTEVAALTPAQAVRLMVGAILAPG